MFSFIVAVVLFLLKYLLSHFKLWFTMKHLLNFLSFVLHCLSLFVIVPLFQLVLSVLHPFLNKLLNYLELH